MKRYLINYLAIVDGIMNSDISFKCNSHRHKNRPGDSDRHQGVKEIRKQKQVDRRGEAEALPEGLQDGGHQVTGVHADQGNQQEVERVPHVFPRSKTKCR